MQKEHNIVIKYLITYFSKKESPNRQFAENLGSPKVFGFVGQCKSIDFDQTLIDL